MRPSWLVAVTAKACCPGVVVSIAAPVATGPTHPPEANSPGAPELSEQLYPASTCCPSVNTAPPTGAVI